MKAGSRNFRHRYLIAFLPRYTDESMFLLTRCLGSDLENMFSTEEIQIKSCPIYFFPFDTDLISLELHNVYRDFHTVGR